VASLVFFLVFSLGSGLVVKKHKCKLEKSVYFTLFTGWFYFLLNFIFWIILINGYTKG